MRSVFGAILAGGFTAGTLDIAYALIMTSLRGGDPIRLLQFIASGLIGRETASAGGVGAAGLGLVLHFFIALCMAAAYVLASLRIPLLARRPILCGIAYGILLFFFMQHVVLPLSLVVQRPVPPDALVRGLLAHAFLVGLPIAFFAARRRPRAA